MKKTLFLLAAAAISTACSMDETTDAVVEGLPIDFRTPVVTRATEIKEDDVTSITVTAIDNVTNENYFTNVVFTEKGEYFKSETDYYWPVNELTFYAYNTSEDLSCIEGGKVNISNGATTVKYTPKKTISEQKDFITATATGTKTDADPGMALEFKHRLSQIEIKAKNTSTTKFSIKVKGVKIANVKKVGTFDFATGDWTEGDETLGDGNDIATYNTTEYTEKTLAEEEQSLMDTDGDNAMLIPQTLEAWNPSSDEKNDKKGAYLAVNIQIVENDGASGSEQLYPAVDGEYGWAAVPLSGEWQAGYKYTYMLDFSKGAGYVDPDDDDHPGEKILGDPIMFTVTVSDDWNTNTDTPEVDLGGE